MTGLKLKELKDQVLQLPERERAEFVHDVIASLDGDAEENVEEAWANEIVQRVRELKSGAIQTIGATEAMERIAARVRDSH